MLQAKRRMAAQRERELRNYHQEQQYNRSKFHWSKMQLTFANAMIFLQTYPRRASLIAQSVLIR